MNEEGMGIDLVSSGELYTAQKAGFPLEKAYYHGNSKTDEEIKMGVDLKVGHFVVDNKDELDAINRYAQEKGTVQKLILRLTPGIDPHTHEKINTGKVDSKFGIPIETGQAETILKYAIDMQGVEVEGFHCHIGSQILENAPYLDAGNIMLGFIADMKKKYNFDTKYLNLGGGFGIRYTEDDPHFSISENIKKISENLKERCREYGIPMPSILMEPGRSIVAPAGLTLYTAFSVKEIPGYKNYVSIDGGMTDNPRYALYQSQYTCLIANKADKTKDYKATIAGKCCESGDLIQEDVFMPRPERGDLVAVLITGAYNYSMASNYNKLAKPEIVMIRNGQARTVVRRETYEDLISLDL